jgi:hypothetical protein
MELPKTSRGMQNLQHLVGGVSQILLVALGVAFGQKNLVMGIVLSLLAFLANRASSEISYQTSICVMEEYIHNEPKNTNFSIVTSNQQIQKRSVPERPEINKISVGVQEPSGMKGINPKSLYSKNNANRL